MSIDPGLQRIAAARPYPLVFATLSGTHLYGSALIADECFFAGTHPTRHLRFCDERGQRTRFIEQWFVELEHLILLFDASSEQGLPPEAADAIKAVVQTFEPIQVL